MIEPSREFLDNLRKISETISRYITDPKNLKRKKISIDKEDLVFILDGINIELEIARAVAKIVSAKRLAAETVQNVHIDNFKPRTDAEIMRDNEEQIAAHKNLKGVSK